MQNADQSVCWWWQNCQMMEDYSCSAIAVQSWRGECLEIAARWFVAFQSHSEIQTWNWSSLEESCSSSFILTLGEARNSLQMVDARNIRSAKSAPCGLNEPQPWEWIWPQITFSPNVSKSHFFHRSVVFNWNARLPNLTADNSLWKCIFINCFAAC